MCNQIRNPRCICPELDSITSRSGFEAKHNSCYNPVGGEIVLWEWLTEQYIAFYDPDAHAAGSLYPTGHVRLTSDVKEAIRFATKDDARLFILQQSRITPLRPDGVPNRPLIGWSLAIERVPPLTGRPL